MTRVEEPGRQLRVLAVIDTVEVSGPGRQLVASIERLAELGLSVRVLVFRRKGRSVSPFENFLASHSIDYRVVEEGYTFGPGALKRFRTQLNSYAPDLVQTHGYKPSACMFFARSFAFCKTAWIAFFHGATAENLKVRAYHWLDQQLMKKADLVTVMSMHHKNDAVSLGNKVRIVYNAVLLPADPQRGLRTVQRNTKSPVTIGVVGRLSPEKGVDVFLEACSRLDADGYKYRALIAGDGPERESLERMASNLGLGAAVEFVGHLRNTDDLYRQLDVLVIPSRSEGLPNVLLEALRFGLPIAATTVGAIPEVLSDPRAGRLCRVDDAAALERVIREVSSREYALDGLGARDELLDRYSLERRTAALIALYKEAMDLRSRQAGH